MELVDILTALDGYVALGVAVWVIQVGMNQLKETNNQHWAFIERILLQQQNNNQLMMNIVKDVCNDDKD